MSETHELPLPGCTPEPLMSYLKALGILRSVSEQADPDATACWRSDQFVLRSTFDEKGLVQFLLNEYRPTPILAPWNAGSGFYKKWDPGFPSAQDKRQPGYEFFKIWQPKNSGFKSRKAVDALERIDRSTNPAFDAYRTAIRTTKDALANCAERIDIASNLEELKDFARRESWSEKQTKDAVNEFLNSAWLFDTQNSQARIDSAEKDDFVRMMRSNVLDNDALCWLDAALVIVTGEKKNRIEAPLLGSGGNIGNSDFSARFMQLLLQVLPAGENHDPAEDSKTFLRASLLGEGVPGLLNYAVDQFNPGIAGGANMGQGMEAGPALNPWDYVLMIEGAILMAGTVSRRLDAKRTGSAFPFSVDSTPVGFASAGEDDTRGELWLPLWSRPCSIKELSHLLSEGRAEIGARRPRNGVEFARAVASLGTDRGISSFVRLQFQKRFGDNFLATALDRFKVRMHADVRLIEDIDSWLARYRREATKKQKAGYILPERFRSALWIIESAIYDYCRYARRQDFQAVLVGLGRAECELALTDGRHRGKEICRPLSGLSSQWIKAAGDGSAEFEIALALAGVHDRTRETKRNIGPIRCNLEPVSIRYGKTSWIAADEQKERDEQSRRHVVWNSADLPTNMLSVLARRIMDGTRAGCEYLPLDFKRGASLETIALFTAGQLDDRRIADLLRGLVLIDHWQKYPPELVRTSVEDAPPLPREYALLKLLFLSRPLVRQWDEEYQRWNWRLARNIKGTSGKPKLEEGLTIRPEPRVLSLLRSGRVTEACRIAYQRLRSSGLKPLPGPTSSGVSREADWEPDPTVNPQRLGAALLLPVGDGVVNQLIHLVTRQDTQPESESETLVTEGAT